MNTKKFLAALLIFMQTAVPAAYAEIKTIEADGIYIVGDDTNENPAVARERAREDARRAASEKAGVYVESFSEVRSGLLTEDIIRTISASVLQIQKSDVTIKVIDGDALLFTCHVVATVDSAKVLEHFQQDSQDLAEAARRNSELEAQLNRVNSELEALKNQYDAAQTEKAKAQIRQQLKRNEQQFEYSQLVEQGDSFYRAKNFSLAIEYYEKALESYAEDAVAYYRLGNAKRELGNFDDAISNYKKALKINPRYADACNNLGYTLELTGSYKDAAENYQRAVECDETYANAWYNLGNSYLRAENYSQAAENFSTAIKLNANYILAYNNLALACENLGAFDKALENFTRAIESPAYKSNETLARLYNNRGACYQKLQRFDEALNDYDKAAELDPSYSAPLNNRERLRLWLQQ